MPGNICILDSAFCITDGAAVISSTSQGSALDPDSANDWLTAFSCRASRGEDRYAIGLAGTNPAIRAA
jgi:hypothetical protein